METTRRDALKKGIASVAAIAAGSEAASLLADAEEEPATRMRPLDYGLSFICHPSPANSVRFWVESRTRLIDDKTGAFRDYYQCGSCKSENTFGEKDLLYKDNYDFMPIIGGDDLLIFRRSARLSDRYRDVTNAQKVWGSPILKLREARAVVELKEWEKIRDATEASSPIVTQTEISNKETGRTAILECPTKTMNISIEKKMYQVDTGPIAFPDLAKDHDPEIACLSLAFVVFNAPHFADFVIEQPTSVIEDGKEKCQIYHYSKPFSLPAKNRVFALANA